MKINENFTDRSLASLMQDMVKILKPESSFYILSIVYGVGSTILALAIPISVQALVNTVTFGVLIQPLIVLSIVLLLLLVFSSALQGLQTFVIELFHRHFYARTTSDITMNLLGADSKSLRETNGVELVNRYFDVVLVQKNVSLLLTDTVAIVMQTAAGLILIAFYHPYFLIFDFIFVFLIWLVWTLFGKSAMATAINESKAKYKVASWLQDMARNYLYFQSREREEFVANKANGFIENYIVKRTKHFNKVFTQYMLLLAVYALMSAALLGLGGYLVIKGELSLGQLVAAELIITVILSNLTKSGKYLESFYDLYAAVDKVNALYLINQSEHLENEVKSIHHYDITFHDLTVFNEHDRFHFDFKIPFGEKFFVNTHDSKATNTFIDVLKAIPYQHEGRVDIGDHSLFQLSPLDVRDYIYVADRPHFFTGTLKENLLQDKHKDINIYESEIFKVLELDTLLTSLDQGVDTIIQPSGYPLWHSQGVRIEIARALLSNPKVIVITDIFDYLSSAKKKKLLEYLSSLEMTCIIMTKEDVQICKDYRFKDLKLKERSRGDL